MKTSNRTAAFIAKKILLPLLMLSLFMSSANAQFSLSTGLNMSYNDNINSNYQSLSDEVTEFFLEGAYNFPSGNKSFELYYTGSFNYFRKNISRTYHEHSAGIIYSSSFGRKLNSGFSSGGTFNLSLNRSDYSYLDYIGASAFANFRTYVSKRISWKLGYSFDYYNYKEIKDFNNIQNYIYTSLTSHLPSRTSLGIEAGFGAKSYLNSLITSAASGMGMGKHRMGSTSSVLDETVMRIDISGKLAQSLFERTGLSITAGYSKSLSTNDRFLISGNVKSSDNTLDDEYSFEGPFAQITLTQHLPWDMAVVAGGGYQYRRYVDRPAYDLNENIISGERTDNLFTSSLAFIKNFNHFGIRFVYEYLNNSTNDEYYNFKNNIFSIELGAGF